MTGHKMNLQQVASGIEESFSQISQRIETVDDISIKLMQIQMRMDVAKGKGEEAASFPELHREIRLIAELLFYTVENMKETSCEVETLTTYLLSSISPDPLKGGEK